MARVQIEHRDVSSGVLLAEVVASIALAADLGLGQPMEHVLRSCVIATRFAEQLGVSTEDRDTTYWTTLFMSAGCTGSSFELSQVVGDDLAFRSGFLHLTPTPVNLMRYVLRCAGSDRGRVERAKIRTELMLTKMTSIEESFIAHCHVSAQLAQRAGLDERVSSALLQTFTQWDGKGLPHGIGGEQISLAIRIANVATVAAVHAHDRGVDAAVDCLVPFERGLFDPHICAEWRSVAREILADVEAESTWDRVVRAEPAQRRTLAEGELDDALALIADYADLKSPWFAGHSRGVSSLAVAAAREAGVPENDIVTLRRAAFVHDIGRNGIPNSILDKPGPLTPGELERVRLHAYYTDRVLSRAGKLAMLGSIASSAHERADGTGYPRGIAGRTIPMLGRFLEAADAYQAMLEDRPHRAALPREDAAAELRRGARAGEFDGGAVDAVLSAAGHRARKKPIAPAGLTPREIEVLTLAARGGTTRAVASKLGISPKTAGNHLERIYAKIGTSTRAEAALFAMQHNLLPDWEWD